MYSAIPKDWTRVSLSSLGERVKRRNTIGNSNVLTISAVHGLVNQKEFFNKIVASENLSNYFLLEKGEFAYNKSYSNGYPVGVVRKLKRYQAGVLSPLYICFDMSSRNVDDQYAEYFFDSQWFIDEINQIAKEGARNHGLLNVGVGDFFDLEVILPPLTEQQKIAAILSYVDDVIEKIQAQIDKLKDLKNGMMQELLTKGIGHTQFKDSPVGMIPVAWGVKRLGDIASLQRGHDLTKANMKLGPYPVVSSSGFNGMNNEYTTEGPGVVVGRKGSIGRVHFLSSNYWAHDTSLYVTNFFENSVKYVYYLFISLDLQQYGTKSGSPSLNRNDIHPLKLAIPPIKEQTAIANILTNLDDRLDLLHQKSVKLKDQKRALMHDLLTGKVRVNVDS